MVKTFFKAYKLSTMRPELFKMIIETIRLQLIFDDSCIEGSIFDHDSFLKEELIKALVVLKSRLREQLDDAYSTPSSASLAVSEAFDRLEKYVSGGNWNWNLNSGEVQPEDSGDEVEVDVDPYDLEEYDDERGEFAPVICDENGQEIETLRKQRENW